MKPVNNTKKYRKYTSIAITVGIVLMLILSGPVNAVSVTITGLSGTQSYGTQTFNVDITIDGEDKFVPITNLSLDITGARTQTCVFSLDGTPISGYDGITITQIPAPSGSYGYGYGYDSESGYGYNFPYGYGYGYNSGAGGGSITYTYQITFTGFLPGSYNVVANLNTGTSVHPAFSSSAAVFSIVSSGGGGGGGGGGTYPPATDESTTENETVSDETVETPTETEPIITPTDDETTTPISTPVADEEEEEKSWLPGFESISAVIGLLAVAAFAKLQKRRD